MDTSYTINLDASVAYIRERIASRPSIAVVLGSGLGDFADLLVEKKSLNTKDIPHFPVSTIEGHAGKIVFGKLASPSQAPRELVVFQGRIHYYESNDTNVVVYPIEVAHRLGIKKLILTNAAGGVNGQFAAGDLMFIRDYLNLSFENPLIGRADDEIKRIRPAFSPQFLALAESAALAKNIPFKEGVYCWTKGPSYESAAEIKMMGMGGADAVGMSTVPEVILASSYGIEVLGISCITNLATGLSAEKLAHAEVTQVANRVRHHFTELLTSIIISI